jgi:hypothetical protein
VELGDNLMLTGALAAAYLKENANSAIGTFIDMLTDDKKGKLNF